MTRHLLLTRFNLRFRFANTRDAPPSAEWFDRRFALFARFTVPAVAAQRHSDFTWLVLMDHASTADQLARMRAVLPANARCLLCDPRRTLRQELNRDLGDAPPARLLTTRLDSDDAIHADFIGDVQATAAARDDGEPFVVDFPRMYYADVAGRALHRVTVDRPSPFFTLVEPARDVFDTALNFPHHVVHELYPWVRGDAERVVLMLHDGNTSSHIPPQGWSARLRRFVRRRPEPPRFVPVADPAAVAGGFGAGVAALWPAASA
jgi:hypothetical protein